MKLTIHPQASENFNLKINELIAKLISEHPSIEKMTEPTPSNPNTHISFHFNKANIISELKFGWTDNAGKVNAKAFSNEEKTIGLFDNDYKDLVRTAETLQKSINPKGVLSIEILENLIFDWVKLKNRNETQSSAVEFILSECEEQIKEYEIWIPISLLYIESAFVLGKITFRAITKTMIDEYETGLLSKLVEPNEVNAVKIYIERIRKEIQGLATSTIKVEAEPIRAYEVAIEETERVMSVLRLFSPANFTPAKICYSAPWGKQHQDSKKYLLIQDGKIVFHKSGFSDKSDPHWDIGNKELDSYIAAGLDVLNFLLIKEQLTDFQKKYFEAISIYSRSSLAKQLSDKLIYILVALETIFLKDSGEYIQDAISLRMAYILTESIEERRAIISNIKKTYKLRSSFIHHGQNISVDDMAIIDEFIGYANFSLLALTDYVVNDMTLEDFFEFLENKKLSG